MRPRLSAGDRDWDLIRRTLNKLGFNEAPAERRGSDRCRCCRAATDQSFNEAPAERRGSAARPIRQSQGVFCFNEAPAERRGSERAGCSWRCAANASMRPRLSAGDRAAAFLIFEAKLWLQ